MTPEPIEIESAAEHKMSALAKLLLERYLTVPFFIQCASEVIPGGGNVPGGGQNPTITISSQEGFPEVARPKTLAELEAGPKLPAGYWLFVITHHFGGQFDGLFIVANGSNLNDVQLCGSFEEALAWMVSRPGMPTRRIS